jgi:AraC-like DNA-binding protein/mannose-6-phosphate isomerase-like protein (cupin superfamily)
MKADYQKLPESSYNSSFHAFWVKASYFGFHWHYHEALEICFVKKGRGKRIIGDSIANFDDGDLVLVGSNLPHSWITDELFNQSDEKIEVFVIQFNLNLLAPFLSITESESLSRLLDRSISGIAFNGDTTALIKMLLAIENEVGFGRYLKLVELLHLMSLHPQNQTLASSAYKPDYQKYNEERILKVCNYIHAHYKEQINTETLANLIAMNPSAFCRFFKRILGKTVVEYINELRISYICNQLQSSKEPVYKLSFDAGFSSVAYFNRVFKRLTNKTPKSYRSNVLNFQVAS